MAIIVPAAELYGLFERFDQGNYRNPGYQIANFVDYVCQTSLRDPGDRGLRNVALRVMARRLDMKNGGHKIHETVAQWCLASGEVASLRQTIESGIHKSGAGAHAILEIVANSHGSLAPPNDVDWQSRYVDFSFRWPSFFFRHSLQPPRISIHI